MTDSTKKKLADKMLANKKNVASNAKMSMLQQALMSQQESMPKMMGQ